MKTIFIISAAITLAGVLLVKFLMNKKKAIQETLETAPVKRSHHITDVFAQAKNYSE